ncbi:MAG TPA: IS1595 family transposase [Ferruginibacter sp.]|jgi:transposase|nr:IS1595 family transposase [Ferruginibacter sp.]
MNKYTIAQFRKEYPNNDACLDKIFKLRYTNLVCPKCESDKPFNRVEGRRSYFCPSCGFQLYPTKGTIFEKTTTSLLDWFLIIHMQTTTRNGVSAKEIERTLDVCYKTALRMAHQIKILMANRNTEPLTGVIEIDETYIGGLMKNKHGKDKAKYKDENGDFIDNKTGVMGFMERGNTVRAEVMDDEKSFKERVRNNVDKSATLITDSHLSYKGLNKEYNQHEVISHSEKEYARGEYHTNTIEGVWSQLKRTIKGTHIHVSKKHLQKYVDEITFRYNHREKQAEMFDIILSHVV